MFWLDLMNGTNVDTITIDYVCLKSVHPRRLIIPRSLSSIFFPVQTQVRIPTAAIVLQPDITDP